MNKKQRRANAGIISESFPHRERANETIAFAAANKLQTVMKPKRKDDDTAGDKQEMSKFNRAALL